MASTTAAILKIYFQIFLQKANWLEISYQGDS